MTVLAKSTSGPAKKRRPAPVSHLPVPALVPLAALFGPCLAKVQLPDQETDFRAFRVLRRSGYAYEKFPGNVYGVISGKQLELLDEHKIPYKIVG